MNLVGKIFIVLICVMSLVFMAFAVAVYSAHVNWRDVVENSRDTATPEKPVGLRYELEDQQRVNTDLQNQLDSLNKQLTAERADKRQALAALENDNDILKRDRDQQEAEKAKLVQATREAVATMDQNEKRLAALQGELDQIRAELDKAQKARDSSFTTMVAKTDELNNAQLAGAALAARSKTLAADLAAAREVLAKFDLDPNPAKYSGVPPRVFGHVKAVNGDLVELSIGSDDGLMKQHQLEVYREDNGGTYLGRVEVIETAPEKAVARILPEYRKGAIQEGDLVASKLQPGG